jgi:hypothetical protein
MLAPFETAANALGTTAELNHLPCMSFNKRGRISSLLILFVAMF